MFKVTLAISVIFFFLFSFFCFYGLFSLDEYSEDVEQNGLSFKLELRWVQTSK